MTLIIAEAGVNHNGSINKAFKLIDAASYAGANVIKFQTFSASNLVTEYAKKAKYQKNNDSNKDTHYEMIKKLELSHEDHHTLKKYCKKKKIEFLSSAFDIKSLDFLNTLNLKRLKIPSGELTNLPYLEKVASLKKPIILSTGMANLNEIKAAIKILTKNGVLKRDITALHCTTEYPTPLSEVNLNSMITIRDKINIEVGYSDHTSGINISVAAVALGAKIIEKHITLNKNLKGPDHKASMEPKEFKKMVESIREIEIAMGNSNKEPTKSERKNLLVARKSIVAMRDISKGEPYTSQNITTKRPGTGISPMKFNSFLGKKAKRNFKKDELIST